MARMAHPFRKSILKRYFVRFHMSMILAATVGAGVLGDRLLLAAGLHSMAWRYGLSVLVAYGVFFVVVRLWIWYATGLAPSLPEEGLDAVDIPLGGGRSGGSKPFVGFHGGTTGGGGESGGGGASGSWGEGAVEAEQGLVGGGSGGGSGGSFDLDLHVDEGIWILVLLAVLVLVICGAGGYLIYAAPEILPEVALDAALAGGLVKATREMERNHWAGKLLWKTWIPLTVVLATAFVVGYLMQAQCPAAERLMEVLRCPER